MVFIWRIIIIMCLEKWFTELFQTFFNQQKLTSENFFKIWSSWAPVLVHTATVTVYSNWKDKKKEDGFQNSQSHTRSLRDRNNCAKFIYSRVAISSWGKQFLPNLSCCHLNRADSNWTVDELRCLSEKKSKRKKFTILKWWVMTEGTFLKKKERNLWPGIS